MRLRWVIPLLILAGVVATASAKASAPFILTISGPGTVVSGEDVRIRVLLQNTSDHEIFAVISPGEFLEDLSVPYVHGPTGEELPLRAGINGMSLIGSRINLVLSPGVVRDLYINLNVYYDLSRPGRYTVQLKRPVSESSKEGTILSNVTSFTVAPEGTEPSVPLALKLTGPETFISGSDVSVKALITNLSKEKIYLVTNADGVLEDRYYNLKAFVGPNDVQLTGRAVASVRQVIRTVSPNETLEARLGKQILKFDADWIAPRTYRFQLIYATPGGDQKNLAVSNVLAIRVTPPPLGTVTPFTLTLNGPATVVAGDAVRVDLTLKNRSNFETMGPLQQLNLLKYVFSVRDASGREVALNEQVDGIKGANTNMAVQPGGSASSYAILSSFYDLSQPGTYHVQVSQPAYGNPEAGRVFSNVITIRVTAAASR